MLKASVPDPSKGEAAEPWVVLQTGAKAGENELRAYCCKHLAPYKVRIRETLPRTMVGKVGRRELAAEARAAGN